MTMVPIPPPGDFSILLAISEDPDNFESPDHDTRLRISRLCKERYIWRKWDSPGYTILPKGYDAIEAAAKASAAEHAAKEAIEKMAQENAEKEARERVEKEEEKTRSWKQFWIGLFLGWLLSTVTPGDVFGFFVNLFD